jgi:hypothetical protein
MADLAVSLEWFCWLRSQRRVLRGSDLLAAASSSTYAFNRIPVPSEATKEKSSCNANATTPVTTPSIAKAKPGERNKSCEHPPTVLVL